MSKQQIIDALHDLNSKAFEMYIETDDKVTSVFLKDVSDNIHKNLQLIEAFVPEPTYHKPSRHE